MQKGVGMLASAHLLVTFGRLLGVDSMHKPMPKPIVRSRELPACPAGNVPKGWVTGKRKGGITSTIRRLDLSHNCLSGSLPANADFTHWKAARLILDPMSDGCGLCGRIPDSISVSSTKPRDLQLCKGGRYSVPPGWSCSCPTSSSGPPWLPSGAMPSCLLLVMAGLAFATCSAWLLRFCVIWTMCKSAGGPWGTSGVVRALVFGFLVAATCYVAPLLCRGRAVPTNLTVRDILAKSYRKVGSSSGQYLTSDRTSGVSPSCRAEADTSLRNYSSCWQMTNPG